MAVAKNGILERARKISKEQYGGIKKVVLAYSGGLDSNAVGSLLSQIGMQVITVSIDMGQKDKHREKPPFSSKHVFVDAKNEFWEAIKRGIKANCMHEGHFNSGGLSRPVIAKALVDVAKKEGADAIAHGSSGIGNDQLRMENSLRVLGPQFRVLAPVRDWDLHREEELEYLKAQKIPFDAKKTHKYSMDENMWARTIRQGMLVDENTMPSEDMFEWTAGPLEAPKKKEYVEIEFQNGVPVGACLKVENKEVVHETKDVVGLLNKIGGRHGIGRIDAVDDKIVGLKAREIYECPAAVLLSVAHRELERLTLTASELEVKNSIDHKWNRLVYYGGWHTRLRRYLDAFIDESQRAVDGKITLGMHSGSCIVVGRKSPHALYDARLGSREKGGVWDQKEVRHFAKLYGLQDTIAYMIVD
ncbi:argininosuccinate synthase [Candidatus Micrarchaeota archaeon]|nr:argininosuccinate synthase [Candidatus Micrarchaeota archaeon]